MFDWLLNTSVACKEWKNLLSYMKNLKLYSSFLWMGFTCLKATEPLQGDSFLFTIHSPVFPGNHLINFNWMKGWNDFDFEATQ